MLAEEILCGDGEVRVVTGFHHIWLRPWLSPGPPGDDDGNDGNDGDDGDDDCDDGDDGDGDGDGDDDPCMTKLPRSAWCHHITPECRPLASRPA